MFYNYIWFKGECLLRHGRGPSSSISLDSLPRRGLGRISRTILEQPKVAVLSGAKVSICSIWELVKDTKSETLEVGSRTMCFHKPFM